jgi:hypothetical protein
LQFANGHGPNVKIKRGRPRRVQGMEPVSGRRTFLMDPVVFSHSETAESAEFQHSEAYNFFHEDMFKDLRRRRIFRESNEQFQSCSCQMRSIRVI